MARGGINKALVQEAKARLLAQGKHPSIDAVRVALGNTGSKTTISHYLKELDGTGANPALGLNRLTAPLAQTVTVLAEQLLAEADEVIQQARDRYAARETTLTQHLHDAEAKGRELEKHLRTLQQQLKDLTKASQQQATELVDTHKHLGETCAKVQEQGTQLTEKQTQINELNAHYQHAREGLEHFRQHSQDARDVLLAQHEHEVQLLTGQWRAQTHLLGEKQQALVDLHRDNARLIEEFTHIRRENARLEKTLRGLTQRCDHLSSQHAQLLGQKESISEQLAGLQQRLDAKSSECERLNTARSVLESRLALGPPPSS
jgi:chromosome segregation ATPase